MAVVTETRARVVAVVVCGVLVVLGLIVIIPLALVSSSTGGRCMLYAGRHSFGPNSVCTYPIVTAVLFQLVVCLARAVFTAVCLAGVVKAEVMENKIFMFCCAIVDVIACVLTLVSGGVISNGFSVMCSAVFDPHSDRCGSLDIYNPATNSFLQGYYERLKIAEAGVWISWLLWIALVALDLYLLWKADLLTLPNLPFTLPDWPSRGPQHTASNGAREDRPARAGERSEGRVGVTHIFRVENSGSRTPPPQRPVPPRPIVAAGKPLVKKY